MPVATKDGRIQTTKGSAPREQAMPNLSRRDLLRASAVGAAVVAVPMGALSSPARAAVHEDEVDLDALASTTAAGPVMFCIHDAASGEVSILHGTSEVIVQDRRLVARILHAASAQPVR
jgi:hypothetical protein